MTRNDEQSTTVGSGASDAQTSLPDSPNEDRGIRQGIQTPGGLPEWIFETPISEMTQPSLRSLTAGGETRAG